MGKKITKPGLCRLLEKDFGLDGIVQDYITYYNGRIFNLSGVHALYNSRDLKLHIYNKNHRFYSCD